MLSKSLIKDVLGRALSSGGDFAEIFVEDKISNSLAMIDGKMDGIVSGRDFGVGIRIFKGFRSIYVYCNDSSRTSLLSSAEKAASALGQLAGDISLNLTERINPNIHPILYVPSSVENSRKIKVMKTAYDAAKNYSEEISQVLVNYIDSDQKIMIANSEGLLTEDRRVRTRLSIRSIASNGVENQTVLKGQELLRDLKCLKC